MVTRSSAVGVPYALGVDMGYFRYHLFFCTNRREDGSPCCDQYGAEAMRDHLKGRVKALGLTGPGGVRVNLAGCLDRCSEGPVLVVYPEGTWYTYVDRDDLEEILVQHLIGGRVVERLLLPTESSEEPGGKQLLQGGNKGGVDR